MADHPNRHIQRWADDLIAQLCARLAAGATHREIASEMGTTRKSTCAMVRRLKNADDPRLPTNRPASLRLGRPIPADFVEHAKTDGLSGLMHRYTASRETVQRWRAQAGTGGGETMLDARTVPNHFRRVAPTMSVTEACSHFGAGRLTVRRWAQELGIDFQKPRRGRSPGHLKMDRDDTRDMSRAGLAADYLRRFGPVFRCDPTGTPSTKGTHWRRGSFVLTSDEIVERAEHKGWREHAWREVA